MLSNFAILGLTPLLGIVVILFLLLVLAFEIWMFVHAVTNKSITDTAKIWWLVGMVLVHPVVAIVYYFTDYKKSS